MPHTTTPVRIGVLGAADIVKTALLEPSRRVFGVEVTTIAARDRARAEKYAAKAGIPRVLGSYEELLSDPDIDAVYVPLPASLHAEWTEAAIAAGKNVLTEKPFTGNAADAQRVASLAASADTLVMEAYHSHYHPLMARLHEILESGELGTVRSATASFCVPIPPGRDIRWNFELGGGGLLDVGYYPVRLLRELFGANPLVVEASARRRGDVDSYFEGTLDFGEIKAKVISSIWSRRPFESRLEAIGDDGRLRVSFPYHPQQGAKLRIKGLPGKRVERADLRATYDLQLEALRDAILGGTDVPTNAPAAVEQMKVLDALYEAAGMPVRP